MKKKIFFIINPISGTGEEQSIVKLITESIDQEVYDYKIAFTKAQFHAMELAQQAVDEEYDVVAAVGGDGTMHEVGKQLIGTKTALAIFPKGSGNGMALNMKIPLKLNKAIRLLKECKTVKIDTVSINDEKFIGIAGVGFDALIAAKFATYGKRGLRSYVALTFKELNDYVAETYELYIDGQKYERNAFMISFANSAQFGNNAVVAPGATITDGIIDICVMQQFPPITLPLLTMRLFTNTIDKSKYMEILKGKEIFLKQKSKFVHLDGEPYELGQELHIKINPKSLNIVVPGYREVKNFQLQNIAAKL